ncbi:MAG: hypothetical protein V7668_13550 [Cereibacter changlensis]
MNRISPAGLTPPRLRRHLHFIISIVLVSGLMVMGLAHARFSSPASAQEVRNFSSQVVASVARISAAQTSDLEIAAASIHSFDFSALADKSDSLMASCVFPVSEEFLDRLLKTVKVADKNRFSEFPAVAVVQKNGRTVFKINAGRQIWLENGAIYTISSNDFMFIYGMFRGQMLEKGCLLHLYGN